MAPNGLARSDKEVQTARPRVVLYVRVSTKEQTHNHSLNTQEESCRAYCDANSYDVVRVFREEGESAKTANRTAFLEMMAYCTTKKANIQFVVVFDLTRWSRNSQDALAYRAMLARSGVHLRSTRETLDESASGNMVMGMLAVMSQFDNDVKAAKTRLGMQKALQMGRWSWKEPIGYQHVGSGKASELIVDPAVAPLVRRAFEMFSTGMYTKQHLLRELAAQGLRRRSGRPLTSQDFHRLLTNEFYMGVVSSPKWNESHPGAHKSLVDRETFERVQAILSGRRPTSTPCVRNRPDFPLRNFIRCGACSRPLTGYYAKKKYAYYSCPNGACSTATIRRDVVETAFLRFLEEQQPQPEYLKLFAAVVRDVWRKKNQEADEALNASRRRVSALKERKQKLVDAIIDGKLSSEDGRERLDGLKDEIAAAEALEKEKHIEQLDIEAVLAYAEHLLLNAARLWTDANLDQKQRLQRVIFPNGVEFRDGEVLTSGTASLFNSLRGIDLPFEHLASPTGFEPVSPP
jgi:site-specific DNA recombinase